MAQWSDTFFVVVFCYTAGLPGTGQMLTKGGPLPSQLNPSPILVCGTSGVSFDYIKLQLNHATLPTFHMQYSAASLLRSGN